MIQKMENKSFCVYTVLLGNYEELNEQEVMKDSGIDFICFTDNRNITSNTWTIRYIEPELPYDFTRSSRVLKICPHRLLKNYKISLYIDNSVKLLTIPEYIFEELYTDNDLFVCMNHSFRNTVLDEFEEVANLKFEFQNILIKQLNIYQQLAPSIFNEKPYWTGFLIRQHNHEHVVKCMETWLSQIMRYSRRDQLSLNYVKNKCGLKIRSWDIDNHESKYHVWPSAIRHGSPTVNTDFSLSISNKLRSVFLQNKIDQLRIDNKVKDKIIYEQEIELNSWPPIRLLRKITDRLRRKSL